MNVSYSATVTFTRKALELAVKWVYANDGELRMPPQINLASLIRGKKFRDIIPYNMSGLLSYIQQLGNKAVHSERIVKREEAILNLRNLFSFTTWIDYSYSEDYSDVEFDESILGENDKIVKVQSEKDELSKQLAEINKKLEELSNENQTLRKENEEKRKVNEKEYKIDEIFEAQTRERYIDLVIENEGWIIGKNCIPEVEITGIPTPSGKGKADYAERKVSSIYSKKDLEKLVFKRRNKTRLKNIMIKDSITNRAYQKEAIIRVAEAVEKEFSEFLSNENLNSNQINFVKHIVDYIVQTGSIDKEKLQEFPIVNKFGGVGELFKNKTDVLIEIIGAVEKVNGRFEHISQESGFNSN
ncbi:DUF4145 domain-containing protein [Leptotrichia sp. oral taxon 223]|nr:DUF4145 domain-containing protein [Leptotrichia sp. oral taxon 223]